MHRLIGTWFGFLLLVVSAHAQEYMKFLQDKDVLLVEAGERAQRWTMEKGDCFPLVRIEYKKLTDYVWDTTLEGTAVLKLGNATFTVPFGSRQERSEQVASTGLLTKVPESELPSAIANYRESVKQYREALIDQHRSDEAAKIERHLRDLQNQIDALPRR